MPATALSEIRTAMPVLPPSVACPAPTDLIDVLGAVPDPRARRGVRHRLGVVLAVAVCAVPGGARSYVAIAEWGADNLPAAVRLRLGLGRRVVCESTIRRVLQAVDPDALSAAVCAWVATRAPAPSHGFRHVAVDGKTVRGARTPDGAVHLLAALDVTTGAVLGQVRVDGKTNELGLGLFGVLSIIRLRSAELDQHEIAYYFASLAIGLLAGLATAGDSLPLVLMGMIVAVMYVAGHPRLFARYRQQVMLLDSAFTDEAALIRHLENLLGGRVHQVTVQKVDLVNDTTLIDVRYELTLNQITLAPLSGLAR